jgi:hypothetical protein
MNWQMCKGMAHRPPRPSVEMESLAREYDIPIPFAQVADPGPLLIATRGLVPADKCVVLPFSGDLNSWLKSAAALASGLGVARVCLFLPAKASVDVAQSIWNGLGSRITVQFILDQEESK